MTTPLQPDAAAGLDPALRQRLFDEGAADDVAPGRPIPQVPLAEHRNHTPFPSQCFQTVDQHGEVFHVVVLRISLDMLRTAADGSTAHAEEQSPLVTEDAWDGPVNEGSPLWESDFAPYKPRCDVLVAGAASRPSPAPGALSERWGCGIAMRWTDRDAEPAMQHAWSKQLAVTGPRRFSASGVSSPASCAEVLLDWRLAVGGQLRVPAADEHHADGSLKAAAGSRRWEFDPRNPVGLGLDQGFGQAAPQIEHSLDRPFDPLDRHYPSTNLSAVARTWLPRRSLAGRYDNDWLATQWPLPPTDFDQGYWNCAPGDQQLSYPTPGAQIHLLNIHPPLASTAAARWPAPPAGRWSGTLPADRPLLLWRLHNGAMLERALMLDTVVVDLQALQVHLTYRGLLSARAGVRVVETRLQPVHLQALQAGADAAAQV